MTLLDGCALQGLCPDLTLGRVELVALPLGQALVTPAGLEVDGQLLPDLLLGVELVVRLLALEALHRYLVAGLRSLRRNQRLNLLRLSVDGRAQHHALRLDALELGRLKVAQDHDQPAIRSKKRFEKSWTKVSEFEFENEHFLNFGTVFLNAVKFKK